jgi:malate permease and related proteins
LLSISTFVLAMIPLYIMAIIGFTARKLRVFSEHSNPVITQLMLYITLPALILFSLQTTFSIELLVDFIWLVAMSVFVLTVSVFIAAILRKKAALPDMQKSVFESLIIFGNQGFIGFAVIYILMAEQGIIYLTIFNICYLTLIWTYGIYLFTKHDQRINWRVLFFNPGILATLIGVCMLFLPFSWPNMILTTFEGVGKMTIPLSMILIGSFLADIQRKDFLQYGKNVYIWIAAMLKLIILPLTLLVFIFLPVPPSLIIVAMLTAAMPSASTTSVYAQKFGADASFASVGVMLTTILCILTIPILYNILQWVQTYLN